MTDYLSDILERIASGEYSEADIAALQQALKGEEGRSLFQLGKYNITIGEGKDIQIGDRIYAEINDAAVQAIVAAIQSSAAPKSPAQIDFQPYLRSLVDTYKDWWRYYTLTDATGKIQESESGSPSPFDFGLMVQTVPKEKDSVASEANQSQEPQEKIERLPVKDSVASEANQSQEPQEKIERLPVLEGICKYADDHVLLVGRPGSGKSTALIRLLLEMATQALEHGSGKIPILVELRYWQTSVIDRIQAFLHKHDPTLSLDGITLSSLLRQGNFLLLVDGLNELPSETARTQLASFRQDYSKMPMIFTTRDLGLGGDLGIEKKLEMQPLTEEQIKTFIRAYVPDQAEAMLRQLSDRLREFGQTPLLLWMLCEVFQQSPEHQMPSNLAGIFQAFTRMYEDSSVRKHEVALLKGDVRPLSDRRLWKLALQAIAAVMMQRETLVDFRVAIHRDEAERELKRIFSSEQFPVRDILDDLLKYHLLQNRSADQIEFRHQLIQEYYAAEHLLQLLIPTNGESGLTDEQLKRDYLNLLKWTEPIALMLALLDEEEQALRVVKLALGVDLRLGARLAGDAASTFHKATVGEVIALSVADGLKAELLGQTRSEIVLSELLSFLTHPNINIAKVAAFHIEATDNQAAVDTLLGRLNEISNEFFSQKSFGGPDKTGSLWSTHVQALSYLAPQVAVGFLREKLEEYGALLLMTTQAATILMELDGENLIPELIEKFKDAQDEENKKIASGWEEPQEEFQMSDLRDSAIQIDAAVQEAFRTIKFTLPSSEWLSRNHILNLLECSSNYELFISDLIQAFDQEPDYALQKQIIQILGKSKRDTAIHFLVHKLGSDSSNLRAESAKQLIKQKSIDDPNSLEELNKLANHEDWHISWCAAIVLGHLKDSTALPRMMYELENHETPSIRSTAARVLGIIGNSGCVFSLLKTVHSDPDRYVRINAACSLSYFAQEEAISVLQDLLKVQTNSDPHAEIMESLARLGLKEHLLEMVKSKSIDWQKATIEFGKLAKSREDEEEILPDLFKALVDPGHISSNEIINLLSKAADSETLDCLLSALKTPSEYTEDLYFLNRVALVLVNCPPEKIADRLSALKELDKDFDIPQLSWLIQTIQNRCKFYNYEVFHGIVPQGKTIALYFSYAPADASLQTQLANHLTLLERQGIITSWSQRQILPGDEPAQIINQQLNTADIILLLISANSFADDTCYNLEIQQAIERHQAGEAHAIPILLRPVDWAGLPFSQLEVLPKNHQPVTTWANPDEAFREIAEGIREVALDLRQRHSTCS